MSNKLALNLFAFVAFLLISFVVLPDVAMATGGGGGGGGGGDAAGSLNRDLEELREKRKKLEAEKELLENIDLSSEFSQFTDKKKTEARIDALTNELKSLESQEEDIELVLTALYGKNRLKLHGYLRYFTLQAYLGLPPLPLEGLIFRDPLARGAFMLLTLVAATNPLFRVYFENRWGYLFN